MRKTKAQLIAQADRTRKLYLLKRADAEIDRRIAVQVERRAKLVAAGARMTKIFESASPTSIGERQVRVQCSSGQIDRAGEIVVQSGISYASSVPVLFGHDASVPVGRATPYISGGDLHAIIDFAPEGVSAKADEVCGLVKTGVIDTTSIGFDPDPDQMQPMDPKYPRGPQKYVACELLEISFVSVPANSDAQVIARSFNGGQRRAAIASASSVPLLADCPSQAHYAAAMAKHFESRCATTFAAVRRNEPPSRVERLARLEKLRR